MTTAGSVVEGSRAYYPYGAERSASGTLRTDRTFTGQKADGTGLLYYNARYYDPTLGAFISPDSLVPDAGMVVDYNRFLYARGNPLKYSDPTGYIPLDLPDAPKGPPSGADPWVVDFYWKNGLSSNFDDPADQAAVRIGITLYDQYGLNIDEVKFRQAFQREAGNLLRKQP